MNNFINAASDDDHYRFDTARGPRSLREPNRSHTERLEAITARRTVAGMRVNSGPAAIAGDCETSAVPRPLHTRLRRRLVIELENAFPVPWENVVPSVPRTESPTLGTKAELDPIRRDCSERVVFSIYVIRS